MFLYDDLLFDNAPLRGPHSPYNALFSPSYVESTEPVARPANTPRTEAQVAIEQAFCFDGPPDAMVTVAGKTYLYFAGNG